MRCDVASAAGRRPASTRRPPSPPSVQAAINAAGVPARHPRGVSSDILDRRRFLIVIQVLPGAGQRKFADAAGVAPRRRRSSRLESSRPSRAASGRQ
ncbi:hypothetical protein ACU4GD_32050 [Cupriavidus basilensis]